MPETNIERLVNLCSYAGERFDLSQAGGGNASFVENGDLWVTASGWTLSDVQDASGMCRLDRAKLLKSIEKLSAVRQKADKRELERLAAEAVAGARKTTSIRPSIETLMHSLLGPYTLHTHPIPVTALLCRRNWRATVKKLFPNSILVDYQTPGVELSLSLADCLAKSSDSRETTIAFLENHGLIVSAGTVEDVMRITDEVLDTVCGALALDLSRYKLTNRLTKLLRSLSNEPVTSYYCEDAVLLETLSNNPSLLLEKPTWPDQLVYCGSGGVQLESFDDGSPIERFLKNHSHLPKVVVVESNLFLVDRTIRNCRRLEEVLKAHVMMLENANIADVRFLSPEEQKYLLDWEAEKARQRMS